MLGVLQNWTRDLRYHPHVHYLVPALALAPDGTRWLVGNSDFLVHVKPLGELFRAKFRAAMRQTPWAGQLDARVWAKPWVVDCRAVGSGMSALKYLAPYIFRIALSNNRIEGLANDQVTFRYTVGKTGVQKRATLPLDTFIRRFLAHVLPKGFVKVRYHGLAVVDAQGAQTYRRLHRDVLPNSFPFPNLAGAAIERNDADQPTQTIRACQHGGVL